MLTTTPPPPPQYMFLLSRVLLFLCFFISFTIGERIGRCAQRRWTIINGASEAVEQWRVLQKKTARLTKKTRPKAHLGHVEQNHHIS